MSATFDTTTKAAYDAATTAQSRAEAIVASLTGTISVKVFNGSNTEMGSGTMAAPWATAVAGAVVLGEVSSFTVGTTGTPDANWYIRFQNADVSRWARGSFGLSGADYNWSLATWESGQTGTIGTATIVAAGNEAPVFSVAPTVASLGPTGGTVQFTANDPEGGEVFYSLTTTLSGITINASSGLVTVTAAAAGTSGNIVVQAGDGILTTSATCVVTVAESVLLDWHPGHYITTDGTMTTTDVSNVCNYANARSYLKGVVIRPFWKDLETSRGVYDFSIIDSALAQLATGKYLWVQIQTAIFNNAGADAADLVPAYLTTPEFDGGAYDDGTDVKTKIWNAAVMDRKIALIQAMAASYNTTAKFEGVLTGETAMSIATNEGTSNYSPSALATQLQRLCPSARAAFTQKQLGIYVNYISGSGSAQYFQPILEAARSADYVLGGPDSLYLNPSTGRQYINGTLGTTDYRGKVGIQVGDQTSGLSNTSYNIANLFSTCFTAAPGGWGANYGFWLYAPSLPNFAAIMSYLASNPSEYVATYPSEFP
jgi:hypothetical protein